MNKPGRNDPCPCGSGMKFKQCCLGVTAPGSPIISPEGQKIEALVEQAYRADSQQETARSCDLWAEAWLLVKAHIVPGTGRCDDVMFANGDNCMLFNWIQDYTQALQNAALKDPEYARAGIKVCTEVLAAFPDEEGLFCENFRGDLGILHFKAGQYQEGEKILRELIHDLPHRSIGYAYLADMLGEDDHPWSRSGAHDPTAAMVLLETALARPVEDAEDYDLELRLADLKKSGG